MNAVLETERTGITKRISVLYLAYIKTRGVNTEMAASEYKKMAAATSKIGAQRKEEKRL